MQAVQETAYSAAQAAGAKLYSLGTLVKSQASSSSSSYGGGRAGQGGRGRGRGGKKGFQSSYQHSSAPKTSCVIKVGLDAVAEVDRGNHPSQHSQIIGTAADQASMPSSASSGLGATLTAAASDYGSMRWRLVTGLSQLQGGRGFQPLQPTPASASSPADPSLSSASSASCFTPSQPHASSYSDGLNGMAQSYSFASPAEATPTGIRALMRAALAFGSGAETILPHAQDGSNNNDANYEADGAARGRGGGPGRYGGGTRGGGVTAAAVAPERADMLWRCMDAHLTAVNRQVPLV